MRVDVEGSELPVEVYPEDVHDIRILWKLRHLKPGYVGPEEGSRTGVRIPSVTLCPNCGSPTRLSGELRTCVRCGRVIGVEGGARPWMKPSAQKRSYLDGRKWSYPDEEAIVWRGVGGEWLDHVGHFRTVQGTIVRTYVGKDGTKFLSFSESDLFESAVIRDGLEFVFSPESFYLNKEVRITGLVQEHSGPEIDKCAIEITVHYPWQIEIAHEGFNYCSKLR